MHLSRNRYILECKDSYLVAFVIDIHVEIDTFWNVKACREILHSCAAIVEIDTFWNVKHNTGIICVFDRSRNRYILECKVTSGK